MMKQTNRSMEPIELLVAAYIYDIPIVEFWNRNRMAFFDRLYDAKTEQGKKKLPIYILKK